MRNTVSRLDSQNFQDVCALQRSRVESRKNKGEFNVLHLLGALLFVVTIISIF